MRAWSKLNILNPNIVPDCPDPAQIVDKNNKTKWCNPTPDSWSRQCSDLTTGTDRQLQT